MLIHEVVDQFLYSREQGTSRNSKGAASRFTLSTYRYALGTFVDYMEEQAERHTYESISAQNIRDFVRWVNEQTKLEEKPWSVSRYLLVFKVLKVFFKWLEQDEDCQEEGLKSWRTKMPQLCATPKRDRIASPQELRQWRQAFPTNTVLGMRNWAIFSLFMETGMRRSELSSLKLQYLQLEDLQIYIPEGKTESRNVAISERVAKDLKRYLKRRATSRGAESEYLFPSCKKGFKPSTGMITKMFAGMQRRFNLPDLTPHGLRHAFCTYYLRNGGNVERLRNTTGHKTYQAMQHYMHLAKVGGEEQKEEIERCSPLKMLDRTR
jgi:site-specific recombinase XerD